MSYQGMDPAEVQALSRQLQTVSGEVGAVLSAVQRRVGEVDWSGPDADRFRAQWSGDHAQQLRTVVAALQQAAGDAARSAVEQERTSR